MILTKSSGILKQGEIPGKSLGIPKETDSHKILRNLEVKGDSYEILINSETGAYS